MKRLMLFIVLLMYTGSTAFCSTGPADSLKVRNFVIKSFITLTKSKPRNDELDSICSKFGLYTDFSSRYSSFLDTLMCSDAFATCVYAAYIDDYVQGVSEGEIESGIANYEDDLRDSS